MLKVFVLALVLFSASVGASQTRGRSTPSAANTSRATTRVPVKSIFSDFSFGFFNFSTASLEQVNEAAASVHGYNYFMIDYNLSAGRKISLRPVFAFDTAGTNYRNDYQSWSLTFNDDSFIDFIDRDLHAFKDGTRVSGEMRFYAPTSPFSRNAGTIVRVRPKFEATKKLGRGFELVGAFEPDYYVQRRTGYVNEKQQVKGLRNFGYESEVALRYEVTKGWGTSFAVGHEQMWTHGVDAHRVPGQRGENVTFEASGSTSLGPAFLVAGLTQRHDVARPFRKLSLFHSAETEYFLLNSWRF